MSAHSAFSGTTLLKYVLATRHMRDCAPPNALCHVSRAETIFFWFETPERSGFNLYGYHVIVDLIIHIFMSCIRSVNYAYALRYTRAFNESLHVSSPVAAFD